MERGSDGIFSPLLHAIRPGLRHVCRLEAPFQVCDKPAGASTNLQIRFYPAPNLSSAPPTLGSQCRLPVEVAKKSFPLLPRKIRVRLRKKKDTPGSLTCHESRQKQLIFTIKKS